MTLKLRLQRDLTDAMKTREETAVATLRMALAAVTKAEVAGKQQIELTDDQVIDVLRSEAKRRADAAELYEEGGRPERADQERAEAAVLEPYLPAAMSDEDLGAIVAEEVARAAEQGTSGPKAMGTVIKAVRARAGATADGGRVAAAVKTALG